MFDLSTGFITKGKLTTLKSTSADVSCVIASRQSQYEGLTLETSALDFTLFTVVSYPLVINSVDKRNVLYIINFSIN